MSEGGKGSQSAAILETPRLRLRELQQSDFDELYAMFNDPLVMRYYPSTRDERETQQWIDWMEERYAKHSHGLWAVELRSTGEFIGQCGLLLQHVDGRDEVEVGYLFKSSQWHKGYATEAAQACKRYAFETLNASSVISLIRPTNKPSRAVAERNGMTVDKTTTFRGLEALVYRVHAGGNSARAVDVAEDTRMPRGFLGFDHIDARVRSVKAVEAFYDRLMPELGLPKKRHAHVDERGEWHEASDERPYNTIEYYEAPQPGETLFFIGFSEDTSMQPTLTRIAFRIATAGDLPRWRSVLAEIGAVHIEDSASQEYPAIFFEDAAGTKLEICARPPSK
jgi:RimJ/RimL family protein N-acetyltransferase